MEKLADALKRAGISLPAQTIEGEVVDPDPLTTPDCATWCHGRGFRRTGSTFLPHAPDRVPSLSETLSGLTYDYCGCAAGAAARDRHAAARAERDAQLARAAVERIWGDAGIEGKLTRYTLASYLLLPEAKPAVVEKLKRWQATPAWLLLHGEAGVCKTGLAIALLLEALAAGRSGLYVVVPDFLDRIRLTYRHDGERDPDQTDVLASVCDVELLLLDDVGKAPLTEWGREKLFTLVNRREIRERQTIVTTNLTLAELEAHLGKPTFDRIRGAAQAAGESFVLELTGPSQRGVLV